MASVNHSSLFYSIYDLNELGYKVYTKEYKNSYELYVGPFKSDKEAENSLSIIKNKIAKDAYILNKPHTLQKQKLTLENKKLQQNTNNILRTLDGVDMGIQAYLYSSAYEKDGAFSFSLEGYKYGISLTGTKTLGDYIYLIGDFRLTLSDIKFKDSSGYEQKIPESMYEVRIIAGVEGIIKNNLFSPYVGIGYRHLNNDMRGAGGSRHEHTYTYIPIGVTHRFAVNKTARISTSVEYDYFLSGEVTSNVSDLGSTSVAIYGETSTYKQNEAYGLRINAAYEEKSWSVGLFFNYIAMEKSEPEVTYYLSNVYTNWIKKNDTMELGLQIKYRF